MALARSGVLRADLGKEVTVGGGDNGRAEPEERTDPPPRGCGCSRRGKGSSASFCPGAREPT